MTTTVPKCTLHSLIALLAIKLRRLGLCNNLKVIIHLSA